MCKMWASTKTMRIEVHDLKLKLQQVSHSCMILEHQAKVLTSTNTSYSFMKYRRPQETTLTPSLNVVVLRGSLSSLLVALGGKVPRSQLGVCTYNLVTDPAVVYSVVIISDMDNSYTCLEVTGAISV